MDTAPLDLTHAPPFAPDDLSVAGPVSGRPISDDAGMITARLIYFAFIGGFFVPLITVVAVIVAYVNRDPGTLAASHFSFQIRTFWIGLVMLPTAFLLYLLLGVGAASGHGHVLTLLLPVGLTVWWLVLTIGRIGRGLRALNRGQAILG